MIHLTERDARLAGAKVYLGKPCIHGHVGLRYTTSMNCMECAIEKAAKSQRENWERTKAKNRRWYASNPTSAIAGSRARKLAKVNRTPKWADLRAIKEFYAACPEGMEVDHIIPLRGKLVSGLHVLNNLQYLTPHDNRAKGNHYDPSYR